MALRHGVYDSDAHFIINPVTRVMRCDGSSKATLIQHDHNSERFTFEIPLIVEGHDMSKCNVIQVHYNNIDNQTKAQSQGLYEVEDKQISPEKGDMLICSWLISQNATQYVGSLNFLVRFSCVEEDGTISYAWNTAIYTNVSISSGIYNAETVIEDNTDILEQWRQDLFDISDSMAKVVVEDDTLVVENAITPTDSELAQALKDGSFQVYSAFHAVDAGSARTATEAEDAQWALNSDTAGELSYNDQYTEINQATNLEAGLLSFRISTYRLLAGGVKEDVQTATVIADVSCESYSHVFYMRVFSPTTETRILLPCRLYFKPVSGYTKVFNVKLEVIETTVKNDAGIVDVRPTNTAYGLSYYNTIEYKYLSVPSGFV